MHGVLTNHELPSGGLDATEEDRVHEVLLELEDFSSFISLRAVCWLKDVSDALGLGLCHELLLENNNLLILLEDRKGSGIMLNAFLEGVSSFPAGLVRDSRVGDLV